MSGDEDDDFESIAQQKAIDFSKVMLEDEDDDDPEMQLQQQQQQQQQSGLSASLDHFNPNTIDVTVNRPAYDTTDSVAYFEIGAMYTLLYAHVTEGISVPCLFNAENQSL